MGFRWRFRHSITIVPRLLKLTINKRSWSVNLTLGPYSRSWGSARSTSAIDAPGELGLSWRKEHVRSDGGFEGLFVLVTVVLLVIQAVLDALRFAPFVDSLIAAPGWGWLASVWTLHLLLLWPVRRRVVALPLGLVCFIVHPVALTLLG